MKTEKQQAPNQKQSPDSPKKRTSNPVIGKKEWGLILILSLLWGGSFFFVEVAVKELSALTIVFYRVALAAALLLGFLRWQGKKMPTSPGLWACFLVMGALNNLIPFSLIAWGQSHIESSLASILNAATPIFSVILAHFLTKEERLTFNRITGVLIGWLGVSLLIGWDSLQGFSFHVMGQVAVLGAACSYALAAIYGRRFKGLDPIIVATGMLCGSTIMISPIVFIVAPPWTVTPSYQTWMALIGLACLSTALAYIIYFRVLEVAGATNILLVTFLIPVSAISLGVVILGEQLSSNVLAGMCLIFLGLLAIDGRLLTKWKQKRKTSQTSLR